MTRANAIEQRLRGPRDPRAGQRPGRAARQPSTNASSCSAAGAPASRNPTATAAGASTNGSRRPCCSTSAPTTTPFRRPATFRWFDKLPLRHAGYDAARFQADGARIVPGAIVRAGAHVAPRRRADAVASSTSAPRSAKARWSTPGRPSVPARRSAATCTSPAASASAACWNRCRRARPSSRTTASSARAPRSSRASSSSAARCSRWASSSARARGSTTARPREITYGRVPAGSVVVPGNLPAADGSHSLYCAVIVKRVDAQTRAKTSINELLRM